MVVSVFPFVISACQLEPLYALSKMGFGGHPALEDAWRYLQAKRIERGHYHLDHSRQAICNAGTNDRPNKWVTLYALLALRNFS